MTDYISRADAIEAVCKLQKYDLDERNRLRIYAPWHKPKRIFVETEAIYKTIYTLPSADAVDCTDFINWLTEEVMDEEMWELNAEANGEIICRKLVKLGVLEVTEEPSYYIRPSAEAVHGEWQRVDEQPYFRKHYHKVCCSVCHKQGSEKYNFCPNCGARMKGGVE